MDAETSFADHAQPILAASPDLNDDDRAELWDIFHKSKDSNQLAQQLQPVAVPDSLKAQLMDAKKKSAPVAQPIDKATEAITRVGQIDPKILELAEKYPNVTKILAAAAASSKDKGAGEAAEPGKSDSKGKGQDKEPKTPAIAPDVPAVPAGHALVRTSDGALHHIPAENVDKAKQIDPALTVLHVEP